MKLVFSRRDRIAAILDRFGEFKAPDNTPTAEAERLLAAIRAFIAAR